MPAENQSKMFREIHAYMMLLSIINSLIYPPGLLSAAVQVLVLVCVSLLQEYDYVFSIDVEEGKPPLKLPYNVTEDPWAVAQSFIEQHNLSPAYLEQIADFIVKNSKGATLTSEGGDSGGGYVDPFTGNASLLNIGDKAANCRREGFVFLSFCIRKVQSFCIWEVQTTLCLKIAQCESMVTRVFLSRSVLILTVQPSWLVTSE